MEIEIVSKSSELKDIQTFLVAHNVDASLATLRVREDDSDEEQNLTRSLALDPAVVATIAGSLGTVLGALITGLLDYMKQRSVSQAGQIILETRNGDKISVPRGTSIQEIDQLVKKLAEMQDTVQKMHIS